MCLVSSNYNLLLSLHIVCDFSSFFLIIFFLLDQCIFFRLLALCEVSGVWSMCDVFLNNVKTFLIGDFGPTGTYWHVCFHMWCILFYISQAVGAAGGAITIMEMIPEKYKTKIGGKPSLQVGAHNGAIAEVILSFSVTFLVLLIILRGPRKLLAKTFLLALATVSVFVVGSKFTRPFMNPAIVSSFLLILVNNCWYIVMWCILECRHLGGHIYTSLTTHGTIFMCIGSAPTPELFYLRCSFEFYFRLHLWFRKNRRKLEKTMEKYI